jgi:hypothetical protein
MNVANFKLITDVIDGKRHVNYYATVENAKKLKAFSDGSKDVFRYCKQFDLRETAETFKYKTDLVKPATPEMVSKIKNTRKKVQNANHQRIIKSAKQADIETVLSNFSKGRTPAKWVNDEIDNIETTDPNAYLIIENETTDGVRYVEPYPFIVHSANVLDFKRTKRHELLYLIVSCKSDFEENVRYTGYFRGFTIVFEPVEKITTNSNPELTDVKLRRESNTEAIYTAIFAEFRYIITIYKMNVNRILAMPIGYIESDYGFQSVIDTVDASLSNFIRLNIDLKFAVMKAGSPTLLQYKFVKPPDGGDNEGSEYSLKKTVEKGVPLTESEKKVEGITINLNSDRFVNKLTPENLPSLDTYFQYVNTDVSILEFLRSEHDRAELAVLRGIFGIDYNSNHEKVKTATEIFSNDSSVHAALIPFDTHCLEMWKFIVESVAQLMGVSDCQVTYVQDTDYRLTTVGELLRLLESLRNTDAPQSLRVAIYHKVIERLFANEPQKVAEIKMQMEFDPFAGLSFEEAQRRIDSPLVSAMEKKLHLKNKTIFDEINMQYIGFQGFEKLKKHQIIIETANLE